MSERDRSSDVDYEHLTKSELIQELKALHRAVASFVLDRKGIVRDINPNGADLFGRERKAIIGKPFTRFLDERDAGLFEEHVAAVVADARRHAVEVRIQGAAGARSVRIESIASDTSENAGALRSIVLDISEQKNLEDQLRQAQRMEAIGRLAGGIAHDFNNMLMAIIGHTELLLLRVREGDPLRANIEMIQQTTERTAALTRQLVTFSRRQVIAPRVMDLNSVISDMDKMLHRLIGEDIKLVYILNREVGRIKADLSQIEQVLMNLVVNARDAMPQGGTLTISTANLRISETQARERINISAGEYVELTVADTGAGMDAETRGRIFEPFFTTKEKGKGTGLGLSTVYGIVAQSGGDIWVASELGQGTTFRICFPLVEGPAAEQTPAREPARALPKGTETILVVEDDDAVRPVVCEMLRIAGYTVLEARHAGEALLLSESYQEPIHLMLTDVVMPQMGGRQLAERLSGARPDMKVLFMSGHTDDAVIRHGVKNAVMMFLQKPFTPDACARKVRAVLDAARPSE